MRIRVHWENLDIYENEQEREENHEDFELDDDSTPEEIEQAAREAVADHFAWSWWKIDEKGREIDESKTIH